MEQSEVGYREAKELIPIKRKHVRIELELEDEHFIVSLMHAKDKLVCHTLTEVMKKLRKELDKAFPVKRVAASAPKAPKGKERTGLPKGLGNRNRPHPGGKAPEPTAAPPKTA